MQQPIRVVKTSIAAVLEFSVQINGYAHRHDVISVTFSGDSNGKCASLEKALVALPARYALKNVANALLFKGRHKYVTIEELAVGDQKIADDPVRV